MKYKLPYFVTQPVIVIALCGLGLIAWFWPAQTSETSAWVGEFSKALAKVFPPIEAYASKSSFPAATAVYMTLAFLLFPVHFYFAFKELRTNTEESWHKRLWNVQSLGNVVQRLLLLIVGSVGAAFMLFINPGYDFNLLPLNTSRAALAWGGWLVTGAIPAWCISWVICNLMVLINYFSGRS